MAQKICDCGNLIWMCGYIARVSLSDYTQQQSCGERLAVHNVACAEGACVFVWRERKADAFGHAGMHSEGALLLLGGSEV